MDYEKFVVELSRRVGKIIKENFTFGMKKKWKIDNSPLTVTDIAINKLVINTIKKKFPDHNILAEEGSNYSGKNLYVWVCDPLDGTIPFSHGVPICVFSLALTYKGQSILGVVYDPFMDRMFFAEKGKGSFLNRKKIVVSANAEIKNSLFGIASGKAQYDFLPLVKAMRKRHAKIVDFGSITYTGVLVANGEFAGTIFPGHKSHDTAALKVIVEEAGGRVTDIFGNEQRYDRDIRGHLVSNGKLHDKLLRIIRATVKVKHS